MSEKRTPRLLPNELQLVNRCESLGLVTALVDRRGCLRILGGDDSAVEAFFAAPSLRERFLSLRKHAEHDRDGGAILPLCPGLQCFRIGNLGATTHPLLAIAFLREIEQDDVARQACEETDTTLDALLAQVRLRDGVSDLADLARALTWASQDLTAADDRAEEAADELTRELSSTYEQISTLYQLVRSMNSMDDPARVVAIACGQVLETLGFRWFVACFGDRPEISPSLSGRFLALGDLPRTEAEFRAYADPIVHANRTDRWSWVLDPEHDDFAVSVGDEILVELVAHDGRAIGALFCGGRDGTDSDISSVDIKLVDAVADFLGVFHENVCRYQEQHEMFMGTMHAMTGSVDAKDPYTRGHSERVAHVAALLATAVGCDEREVEQIHIAGLLHDVGKIGVPESVLLKSGRLTDAEFDQMKQHPVIGHDILRDIRPLEAMLPGVLHHHERWDGKGYPHQIAGEDIPRIARILALADSFDAMSSNRSYRDAMPRATVLAEISKCAGTQFDPDLAGHFVKLDFSEYDEMVRQAAPQSKLAA